MKRRTKALVGVAAIAAVVGVGGAAGVGGASAAGSCPLPQYQPGRPYQPRFDATGFSADVTNPYFPLRPGRTLVSTGVKDGKRAIDLFVPTTRTRVLDQVPTRVVEDRLYLDGVLRERTSDYYSQDACGNVWYFGEDTAELDRHGKVVSTEGSFHAGVRGAQPGVFMTAAPAVGPWYRQEWAKGHAEDRFTVRGAESSVTVPAGRFPHALRTEERTSLEPGVVDNKYYVRDIGTVSEVTVKGPQEKLALVEVIR
jgi:hypothetical protein